MRLIVDVFVARQAILDKNQRLFAYELLYRPCDQNHSGVVDDSASTLQVLSASLLSAGLSKASEKSPVFINFGRELLVSTWASLFPASNIVIEILESVRADHEVLSACMALKERGYALALDDVTEASDPGFLNLVDFIKIDFRATSPESQARLARCYARAGKYLLAEKVETADEFERAKGLGFHYFQGFFFSKPAVLRGRQVSSAQGSAMRLLKLLNSPEINYQQLEKLIRCDVSLTYKLLRYVNSALFARSKPISGILAALVAMGELDIRRWIVLATLLDLSGSTQVLATHALVRARFCESLAGAAGSRSSSDAFLIGMFSLLDALVHRPLAELLSELGLAPEILAALLGREVESKNALALTLAKNYEAGNWDAVGSSAKKLGTSGGRVAAIYLEAVEWASRMLAVTEGSSGSSSRQPIGKLAANEPGNGNDLLALHKAVTPAVADKERVIHPEPVLRSRKP